MPETPKVKTWRELKSETPKPVSWRARFRAFMKFFRRTLYLAALVALCAVGYKAYEDGYFEKAFKPKSETLSQIGYRTDGRITKAWLNRNGFFPPAQDLADIDILLLKEKFENLGQVKSATLEKVYPNKITIDLAERTPIARMAVMRGEKISVYCMDTDGVFFEPIDYKTDELEKLKWLTGVPLVIISERLAPFSRARALEAFLTESRRKLPSHYETWETVNVREMGSITLPLIMVTTTSGVKIVFHADDISFGLEKLEYVLRFCPETNLINIDKDAEKIDLSISGQAVISPRKTK